MNNSHSRILLSSLPLLLACVTVDAKTFHVSPVGNDGYPGSKSAPLRTIQRAADLAQPGDVITVHEGIYRERINPPRGGTSDKSRIVYQAAPGENVQIRGSERVKGWVKVQEDVWQVVLPNSFFGGFNPYSDLIRGDWFDPRGRAHHTGAVYLNGEWLVEAAKLDEVLAPGGAVPAWLGGGGGDYLLNVAWIRPADGQRTAANSFAAQEGIQTAACSEGGECIGWIEDGDWVRYDGVDLGRKTEQVEFRAASATRGGVIEIRLNGKEGELLGSCPVRNTGDWQSWSTFKARIKPLGGVQNLCLVFKAQKQALAIEKATDQQLWFAQVDATNTTIWAQFKGANPNQALVEINVRRAVFYPDQPGRNYITVRGFDLSQAATPWAPPTAEQVGLIGTHWSKGWIIENNVIHHSTCSGVALGKYGDQWDNTSANTAEGYVKTIERALQNGWNKETIGHHVVRNNTISHCEQTGVVGSLGSAFSTVTGNVIHDIHVRRFFSGAEMAGIKFHAAIDTVIQGNHIYRTCRGLWLDWMAQGTRVSGNLFHENAAEDLFLEVDHGPYMVDNNVFLSPTSVLDMSEGGAYAHNLFNGRIVSRPELSRQTPYHPAHSTAVAGLVDIKGGENRFYNNLFVGKAAGLSSYDPREFPLQTAGNLYYGGARPYAKESNCAAYADLDPKVKLVQQQSRFLLELNFGPELKKTDTKLVTSSLLGKARIPGVGYENADGSPLTIRTDYFGKTRSKTHPSAGPFESPETSAVALKVW